MGDGSLFLDEELLLAGPTREVILRPEGQGDIVVILTLISLDNLEGHGNSLVLTTVLTGVLPGRLHG